MTFASQIAFIIFSIYPAACLLPQKFEFLPDHNRALSIKTYEYEPRFGVSLFPSDGKLKVDVGNIQDIVRFDLDTTGNVFITSSVEFFAYADITSYKDYRLQVAAIDGFFGGRFSYINRTETRENSLRLRFIHRSAHLVDGYYDYNTRFWIDGKDPVPYANDFFELASFNSVISSDNRATLSIGVAGSILVRPQSQSSVYGFVAFEDFYSTGLLFLGKNLNLFLSYTLRLQGLSDYSGNNHLMAGVKIGERDQTGVSIFASYYAGLNYYGAFYTKYVSRFSLGFTVDFS